MTLVTGYNKRCGDLLFIFGYNTTQSSISVSSGLPLARPATAYLSWEAGQSSRYIYTASTKSEPTLNGNLVLNKHQICILKGRFFSVGYNSKTFFFLISVNFAWVFYRKLIFLDNIYTVLDEICIPEIDTIF